MSPKVYFVLGALSFMTAGAAAGSYATFVGLHKLTDGETTKSFSYALSDKVVDRIRKKVKTHAGSENDSASESQGTPEYIKHQRDL